MEDICNFIPPKKHKSDLEFIHFVYETGIKRLCQPFSHFYFRIFLVFKGTAVLKVEGKNIPLEKGDVFFAFPYQSYIIDYDADFSYFYISFAGEGAASLLESVDVSKENNCFKGLQSITDFWVESIRRVNLSNANTLTESVLMYTLSYVANFDKKEKQKTKDKFDIILDYVNHNFTSSDISLGKIGDIFYYTEKHLSYLFVSKMGVKFTKYVNDLRIHYAKRLIECGAKNVTELAFKCGYTDRYYFSKIFKKNTGLTPTEYIAECCEKTDNKYN